LSKLRHASKSLGSLKIEFKELDKCVAQAGLADFGMCLIRPLCGSEGCMKTDRDVDVVDIDDAMTVEV
jgi:hypothetical protein